MTNASGNRYHLTIIEGQYRSSFTFPTEEQRAAAVVKVTMCRPKAKMEVKDVKRYVVMPESSEFGVRFVVYDATTFKVVAYCHTRGVADDVAKLWEAID